MNKHYVIQWKSKVNGRAGRGTKVFEKMEAEQLVEELNREYPQIVHELVEAEPLPDQSESPSRPASAPAAVLAMV
ncbi:MAG: hypothetical protein ACTHLW_12435 [Verrucomicrobiota bacterium]